jgi:predicted histidine transporter YuiF (NhaC family)
MTCLQTRMRGAMLVTGLVPTVGQGCSFAKVPSASYA